MRSHADAADSLHAQGARWRVAVALSLATAVSLGLARFSYALMLPPMRADLGWSYLTAGAMNTANALGYLCGALLAPIALRRLEPRIVMLAGSAATSLLLAAHAGARGDDALYLLRALTGLVSAGTFVGGGVLAARLAGRPGLQPGLVLGIYYGGVGGGIIVSALAVPPLTGMATPHAWSWAWLALGACAGGATLLTAIGTRSLSGASPGTTSPASPAGFAWRPMAPGLMSYFFFGMGYIGYMTFVVSLLRERHFSDGAITAFYTLLGLGVLMSSWLWAGLLQRHKGGQVMLRLNALLVVATVLPVLSRHPAVVMVSGLLFGCVFLSVVASTTALVRHNLPAAAWPRGIGAFTVVFAAGQIVGPTLTGWLADGPGGLARGLAVSAGVHALAALLAWRQKPLSGPTGIPAGQPAR